MDYIDELDAEQKTAALHPPAPLIVYAGAGSGKTKLLVARIAHQIDTGVVDPKKIFASTFTKAAAEEMKSRVIGLVDADDLTIGTFHSLMYRFLNDERYAAGAERLNVCKDFERKKILQGLLGKPSKEYPNAIGMDADYGTVSGWISRWKSNLIHSHDEEIHQTTIDAPYGSDMWSAAKIYPMYESVLTLQGKVDFDDMLLKAYDLLSGSAASLGRAREKWEAFFIDEGQDTSVAQWAILKLLADPGLEPNITVVGDTRQALYRFTSAVPELMDDFVNIYSGATRIDLIANYRSTDKIIDAANNMAAPFSIPNQKSIRGTGAKPSFVYFPHESAQAQFVVDTVKAARKHGQLGSSVAVLVRTNAQTALIESAFVSEGLPYWCKNGGFFQRMEVGDIMAYLRLINDHTDVDSLSRIINKPTRYLGAVYVEQVQKNSSRFNGDLIKGMAVTDSYASKKMFGKQKESALALAELIKSLSPDHGVEVSPSFAISRIMVDTNYLDWLKTNSGIADGGDDSKVENLDKLKELAAKYATISSFIEFCDETTRLQVDSGDSTEICTVHGSKGREWPTVFVTNFYDGSIPHNNAVREGHVADERRVAYVAMTRAQDSLIMGIPAVNSKGAPVDASRFMKDLLLDQDQIHDLTTGVSPETLLASVEQ